jgi:hypothetical protein
MPEAWQINNTEAGCSSHAGAAWRSAMIVRLNRLSFLSIDFYPDRPVPDRLSLCYLATKPKGKYWSRR